MAERYYDTDGGNDGSDGTTWANAKLTPEGMLAVMSAGDNGWGQGAAVSTSASNRTFTSPGTKQNPCIITGVVDGTTNEPPLLADLAVTLPKIETTSAADITFAGYSTWNNIHLSTADKIIAATGDSFTLTIVNGKFTIQDDVIAIANANIRFVLINSILETTATTAGFARGVLEMHGGSILSTVAASIVDDISNTDKKDHTLTGVDVSGRGTTAIIVPADTQHNVILRNCITPSVFNLFGSAPTSQSSVECIACSDTTSVDATDSIQDYQYQDAHGNVDLEKTATRTGGADDDASGAFAYAMTPAASATLESSAATLKSPWCSVWVDGGSNTLTVFIANDSASTDYNQDEVWVEFYTPDVGDTAQYDQTFDPGDARLFASSTAITDDTGSTWGAGGSNHQKMSVTVTTGYTGWAYCRLHLAKRDATPDTLFLDPRIVVS